MRSYKSPKKVTAMSGRKSIGNPPARKNISTFDSDSTDSSESDDDETSSDDATGDLTHRRGSTSNRKNSLAMFSSDEEEDEDEEEDDSSSSEEEGIDYVQLTKNRRKLKDHKFIKETRISTESAEEGEIIEQSASELDDDLVDQVLMKEEKKFNDEVSLNDLDDLDFDLDFNDSSIFDPENIGNTSSLQVSKKLEDIGEVIPSKNLSNRKNSLHVEMKVPKFDEKDIDSEDDYELDKDQLIQTLMADNDDSELQIEGDEDDDGDDFDRLAESRRQYTPGSERDVITGDDEEEDVSDADSDKLMALETKAMVDDFYENRTRKLLRRGSIYRNGVVVDMDDDLELDRLDNFEDMFPKQQASFRRRSSILDQSLLSSSDDDDGLSKFRSKVKRRKSKKSSKKASDIRRMLGPIKDGEYIDTIESDSNDDTNLVLNILNEEDENSSSILSDDETDEDFDLPNKSTKRHKGSRHAKEVLSSSSLGFGAPPLGTFTTRKPYSVIDGVSTRFVQPFESPRKAAKLAKRGSLRPKEDQMGDPIPLDELLNIDEFDEDNGVDEDDPFDDPAHDHETNDKLQEMFGEKRIPLTAFRNKGLVNKYPQQLVEPLHQHRRKTIKKRVKIALVEEVPPAMQEMPALPPLKELDEYIISNQGEIEGFAAIASDDEEVDAVAVKAHTNGRRKLLRRASMVEAQREGKRATKAGVFDAGVMENVEAFLVDVGANDEFSFLVAND